MKRLAIGLTMAVGLGSSFVAANYLPFNGSQRGARPEHRGLIDPRQGPGGRILIDASRDGGLWWFPQRESLDVGKLYQGKQLADDLRRRPFPVDELPRDARVTADLLSRYTAVIRAGVCGPLLDQTAPRGRYTIGDPAGACVPYSEAEISAYRAFVDNGGRLLLLSSFIRPGMDDELASSFALRLGGGFLTAKTP